MKSRVAVPAAPSGIEVGDAKTSDATLRQGLAGERITMKTKVPIPQWLKDWKANRPRYHNYSGTEGDGCFGPAEGDVQTTAADTPHTNGAAKKRVKSNKKT
jgi:hypothetical protein